MSSSKSSWVHIELSTLRPIIPSFAFDNLYSGSRPTTVKTAADTARYTSPWQCISTTVKQSGVRGLYRGKDDEAMMTVPSYDNCVRTIGLGLTLARDFIGIGIYFSMYQSALRVINSRPVKRTRVENAYVPVTHLCL
jgi:hypothetical protein